MPSLAKGSVRRDRFGDEIVRYVRIPLDDITAAAMESLRESEGSPFGTKIRGQSDAEFLKWCLREAICCLADACESVERERKWRKGLRKHVPYRPSFRMQYKRSADGKGWEFGDQRWFDRRDRRDAMSAVEKLMAAEPATSQPNEE